MNCLLGNPSVAVIAAAVMFRMVNVNKEADGNGSRLLSVAIVPSQVNDEATWST